MITHKTTGFVLKTKPYLENDQLVTVYTKDYGKITIKAKGSKKIQSKNAPALLPGTYSEFEIVEKKGICPLIRAEIIDYYRNIKEDIKKEIIASSIMEYYYRYVDENKPDIQAFKKIKQYFDLINENVNLSSIYYSFLLSVIKENGILLNLNECTICHHTKVYGFSITNGGFVCAKHFEENDYVLSLNEMKMLRYLYYLSPDKLKKIDIQTNFTYLSKIIDYYVEESCGIYLKTKSFLKVAL